MPENPTKYLHRLLLEGAPICTDSRQAAPKAIFFALQGEQFNGNDFAPQALRGGCQVAIVERIPPGEKGNYLQVDNVLETLQNLGQMHRRRFDIPVLGITGSNGKTTTKELIKNVLETRFATLASSGNLNNHIGVPLTLLSLRPQVEVAVVEMGANHQGEISRLCELADPSLGIITNIGKAHLEGFGSPEKVVEAKSELFHHIRSKQGLLFVNHDDPLLRRLSEGTSRIYYGQGPGSHLRGHILQTYPTLSFEFQVDKPFGKAREGGQGIIHSRITGDYNLANFMAAVTVGLYFAVPEKAVVRALESYTPDNMRSQMVQTSHNLLILDAYNANPSSMFAAIRHFTRFQAHGKTAVMLGDMLELGDQALQEHDAIYREAMDEAFDLYAFVGECFSRVAHPGKNCLVFRDSGELSSWLQKEGLKGYTVLIKGSRGIAMETVTKHL